MDALRLGAVVRAVRLRRRWRQSDVARHARVSATSVSRLERGRLDGMPVATIVGIAAALDIRVDWVARWRGGELDRMLNAGHAAMHEAVARALAGPGWLTAPEATFSIYGERGAIDILGFHPATGVLLVVEMKTALVDVNALIGSVDRYRRLAAKVARDRGWQAQSVSCWVALRESPTNRRRLRAHATVLRAAFPDDGRRVRAWLRQPAGTLSALSFLSDVHPMTARTASTGVLRVRRRPASVDAGRNHG